MSWFREVMHCRRGDHHPDAHLDVELSLTGGKKVRYAKCMDCGQVIALLPYGSGRWCVITGVLGLMPQDHYDVVRKLGIVGLTPPQPWPGAHTGRALAPEGTKPPITLGSATLFRGGPLPEGIEKVGDLQAMLPGAPAASEPRSVLEGRGTMVGFGRAAKLADPDGDHALRGRAKDVVYSAIARTVATLGTCCRLKVGCVLLTQEGRVAGLGYNGAGPGMPHCVEDHCNSECRCIRTLHAEQNALFARTAAPYTAHVTHEPCLNCTKELALAGVRRVVYGKPYTSISPEERTARQEWIDHYKIAWEELPEE